jgi:hypothetical protein
MIAQLRPKMVVRNIVIDGIQNLADSPPFPFDQFVRGHFSIINIGGTTANVNEICYQLFVGKELPMQRPYEERIKANSWPSERPVIKRVQTDKIGPGEAEQIIISIPPMELESSEAWHLAKRDITIYFMGFIRYRDELGLKRRTDFCRRFDWDRMRFYPVADPDYEQPD